ncbi:MAG: insulinase family protein, partial [Clostridia bacterium]|nr:insulinase family protein [Clostridia bacterium]
MVHLKTLDNGIRLIVKEMPGLMSVTMGILVKTGAYLETDAEDGISHFIEHMMFKGTKKRTAFMISDEMDRIGAQMNAFTGKDLTCYYAKSTTSHAKEAFEILSDL